jgi:hypothetical protein
MPVAGPRKTNPIVWVVVAVLGVILLGIVGIAGAGAFFVHRAGRNPAAALARVAAMSNPNLQVLNQDDSAGTVTVRDRQTGKTVTMNFNDAKNGHFQISAQDENGKTADLQFGGGAKAPDWVPVYPGASVQANITGSAADGDGGNVTYGTPDSPTQVLAFYQDKIKELGMETNLTTTTADGAMMVASDQAKNRSLTVLVGKNAGKTSINVTYGSKR